MSEAVVCPYCGGGMRTSPGDAGRLRGCPWCRNLLLMQDLRVPLAPLYRLRLGSLMRRSSELARESAVNLVATLGIMGSFVGTLLAVLAILAALNAFVPEVRQGVEKALPRVSAPLSEPAALSKWAMVGSASVVGVVALVFLADMIGLLRRREWARRLFFVTAWFMFAVFIGQMVGLVIMPDSSIKAWTVLVVVPAVVYFGLSLRLLHRREVRQAFH